ncbi:hypothetical protein [Nocardia sp. NPDC052566]|uniref:hypothetical protein n=1 Tax=Nocardia sp. NPDC052566 TaxID=3364330 RepID=UPI0037C531D1
MASEGDAKDNESDRSASEFGPPISAAGGEFGPPVAEFGPPVTEFGPPVAGFGGPVAESGGAQWPDPAADHPELGWRPASDAVPPAPQYRAPDTTVFPAPPVPAPPVTPAQPPASSDPTVRHSTMPAEPQGETWWNRADEPAEPPASPASPPGLSWADDPIAQRLAPSFQRAAPPPPKQRSRTPLIVSGSVAAVAVLVGIAALIIALTSGNEPDGPKTPQASPGATLSCPASKDGKVTVGNGPGDTASGAGAIFGFQYAFYVERSGERARKFVAPDNENVSSAEIIQKAIDEQIPAGTTHCVRITDVGSGAYDVDLTEHRPDGTTNVYKQTVVTAHRDDKYLVKSIGER